jgi:CheY-like chemotaxis protein
MHDHLQQTLVGAKMRLGLLRKRHPTTDPADAIEAVDLLLGEAVNLTRSLSAELYPPVLHEHGLVAALRWLAESKANKYHLTIDLNLDPQAEPAPALRTMLFHAARELLFNVQKYAKVKQAHLSLQRPDDQHIVLTVRDQGVGFDPATTSRPRDGGLGLFSIRERIAILGGRLTLESSPGAGTTVTLLVPAPRQTPRAEPSPAAGAQQPPPRRHRGVLRVLLADDHRIVRQGLSLLLGEHDDLHIIGEAGDGLQAIELAQSLQPDVILMDVTMPTLDGIEATRRIKQRHPHIRVIGLSMRDDADTFQAMIHAGADDHLAKDGDEQRLLQAIRANA